MNRNTRFLMLAQKLSKTSGQNFKVAAVIVKGNRVISYGVNNSKTHPKAGLPFKSTHAEHQAILNAGLTNIEGAVCYVYRSIKEGPAMSKPCLKCQCLLKTAGIKSVYFSVKEYPFYETLNL